MRFEIKPAAIAVSIILCLVLIMGLTYVYLSLNARRIFNAQISSLTRRHVEAKDVRAEFPARLVVEGLSIDGILTCEQVRASIDVLSLLGRDIRIRTLELVRPSLIWEQTAPETETSAEAVLSEKGAKVAHKAVVVRSVILAKLLIHNGIVKVVTNKADGKTRAYVIDGVQLRARNVPLTDTPARTEFFATASLVQLNVPFVGHFLKASGWLNWAAKDMDAIAQVMDDNGKVGLDAKIFSRQNDMAVSGSVILAGGQEAQATGKKAGMVENVLLNVMMSTNSDIDMGFSFKTKMSRPEIGTVNLSGHITTGLNSSVTSGNIVAGLKAAGEELLKTPESGGTQK